MSCPAQLMWVQKTLGNRRFRNQLTPVMVQASPGRASAMKQWPSMYVAQSWSSVLVCSRSSQHQTWLQSNKLLGRYHITDFQAHSSIQYKCHVRNSSHWLLVSIGSGCAVSTTIVIMVGSSTEYGPTYAQVMKGHHQQLQQRNRSTSRPRFERQQQQQPQYQL